MLFGSRRCALASIAAGALFLTYGAGIHVLGCNVQPTRLLVYTCFFRVLSRREFSFSQLVHADKAIILLYIYTTSILLLRSEGSAAFAFAKALDGVLSYLVFRAFIQTFDDFKWFSQVFVLLLVPYAAIVSFESVTQRNLFDLVGARTESWIRDGKLRCYGSFRHPSLLGSLGACFLPVFAGLAMDPAQRKQMALGCVVCTLIVLASNSGGPISTMAVAVVGLLHWPLRTRMRTVRLCLLGMITALIFVMNAPIWYLLARISNITGGGGYHRSYLLDVALKHFGQWGIIGMPIENTADWFPYILPTTGGADITNQYLNFGMQAGLVAIALFVYFIYAAFSCLGKALFWARSTATSPSHEPILWGLGVTLAAHVFNWFGISYFDQFQILWLLQMAALVSLSHSLLRVRADTEIPVDRCELALN